MERYILVTEESFSKGRLPSVAACFRSFEKYLEKYQRVYVCNDFEKTITVEVKDELDAVTVAEGGELVRVQYHADGSDTELVMKPPKKLGRPRATVTVGGAAKKMTINQYRKYTLGELKKTHLQKGQIIKAGLLTKTKLEHLISEGKLTPVQHGKLVFINRNELMGLL